MCDRVMRSKRPARNTSMRWPRSSGPIWSFIAKHLPCQQNHSNGDGRVRDIKGRPVVATSMEFEEIDDITVSDAVIEVSQRTRQHQGQGALQHPIARIISKAIYDHNCGGDS